mmetsp:Transcript_8405/g.11751  ORF Transcript_8405/g.11751 Transcript_8405/m.11751 type:complete len:307 (+) Transcript_8405:76-996(+)
MKMKLRSLALPASGLIIGWGQAKGIFRKGECDVSDEHAWRKKFSAGRRSVDYYVKSGMNVAVGTGSIGNIVIDRIAQKFKEKDLVNINILPCSEELKRRAISLGLPVCSIDDVTHVDVSISGADEVDQSMTMVKGKTGCFLREKMIEQAADLVIVAVEDSKLTKKLGTGAPLPVEILPFSPKFTRDQIQRLPSLKGCRASIRRGSISTNITDGEDIAVTDNGNFIIDIYFDNPIKDVAAVAKDLDSLAGVVGHGLFINLASILLVADNKEVYTISRGDDGPDHLWACLVVKYPLERAALDNREPFE